MNKIQSSPDEELYSTTDMYFACILLALNYKLIDVVSPDTSFRKSFLFEISPDKQTPEEISELYYAKSLPIDAKTLIESIKTIKTRLHA